MFQPTPTLTILFATETGMACVLAEWALAKAGALGTAARLIDMATYNTTRFAGERDVLIITSTHGEGNPPTTASDFFDFLDETSVDLSGLCFAVLALGDSGYDQYCAAGKRVDGRLEALGAHRLIERRDSDVGEGRQDREWLANAISQFAASNCNA
jgi:sulfite reductase (NADPH) flavoprotein alpha-component